MSIIYAELKDNINVRANLSALRRQIKADGETERVKREWQEHERVIVEFLSSEDAKTRKNAALLLGDLRCLSAAEALYEAYQKESTLFARSAYLQALSQMDVEEYVPRFKSRLKELTGAPAEEENRKHVEEEIRALRRIIIRYEGISRHTFAANGQKVQVLLVTNRENREFIRLRLSESCPGRAQSHPLGILVETESLKQLMQNRLYRELLFPLELKKGKLLEADPETAAAGLWDSDLAELLKRLHREEGAFYFRIECKSPMTLEERSDFSRRLASELERRSGGLLINSTSDYEVEIRLIANREGRFFPCIKLYTLTNPRFSYRKNAIASSVHPSTAALLMELAEPYLQEDAQVIDPFCGVGTMLVERSLKSGTHDMYGTDIFGDAIEMARENASLAGMEINFIHRDFFDFKHGYLFDEIVTNMPVRGRKTRQEMEQLYARFFRKAGEILKKDGVILMYTNEIGLVKRQLRIHREYQLLLEKTIQAKSGYELVVIRYNAVFRD